MFSFLLTHVPSFGSPPDSLLQQILWGKIKGEGFLTTQKASCYHSESYKIYIHKLKLFSSMTTQCKVRIWLPSNNMIKISHWKITISPINVPWPGWDQYSILSVEPKRCLYNGSLYQYYNCNCNCNLWISKFQNHHFYNMKIFFNIDCERVNCNVSDVTVKHILY